jgi:HD-GYP domain-containing protein (c-di-GMP phosphodiesterase class II)
MSKDSKNVTREQIERLTQIGIALSSTRDVNEFFTLILSEAISYTNADAGTLYLTADDKQALDFQVIYNKTMNIPMKVIDKSFGWKPVPLFVDNEKNLKNMVSYVFHTKEPMMIEDVYYQELFDSSGTKAYDAANGYRSKSMLAIPMKNHEDEVLGVIQLINAMDNAGTVIPFDKDDSSHLMSLTSQAGILLTNRQLIMGLERLLHDFLKSIAKAIEHDSKYTSGHISRVARLTEMLSQTMNRDAQYYPDVNFSEDELKEISMAGWMHDIGKITTPPHIRDKARKLETIIDRIALVRSRYQAIKLGLQLQHTCGTLNDHTYAKEIEYINDAMKFIETSNTGGEFITPDAKARLQEIHDKAYTFNDETIHLINDDELRNLQIPKGTLLPEERDKIQEHAKVSWEMLSSITFPAKYRNVPLFAAAHHEQLSGKGYPFGLSAQEIPLPARIVAVADIFEALSAKDRPYRTSSTLSQALRIMTFFVKDNSIDKDIFFMFLDSGLYLEYAQKFMDPQQLDEVDIEAVKAACQPRD